MKLAWHRSKVPIIGVIGIVLIALLAFAFVRPDLLEVNTPASITGNVVVDDLLFPRITADAPCSNLDDSVCGADGETYRNLCYTRKAGTDMKHKGACSGWVKE
ncbi:hypothetical protein GOV07_03900 [Candidatus Woesearchaeota archaeon]|nr:hypothetical protein [Candidatus Woesearchaeota archaeon]